MRYSLSFKTSKQNVPKKNEKKKSLVFQNILYYDFQRIYDFFLIKFFCRRDTNKHNEYRYQIDFVMHVSNIF